MTSTILGIIVLVTVLGGSFYLSRRNNRVRRERAEFIRGYRFPSGLRFAGSGLPRSLRRAGQPDP